MHSNHSIEIVDKCKKPKTAQVSINRNWSNYGKSRRWNAKWTLKETRQICMYVLTWKDLEDVLVKKYIKYKGEGGHIEWCISGGGGMYQSLLQFLSALQSNYKILLAVVIFRQINEGQGMDVEDFYFSFCTILCLCFCPQRQNVIDFNKG